jgi:hypothetical protein
MRLKTAYRPKNIPTEETPAPNIREIKVDDQRVAPSEKVSVEFSDKANPEATVAAIDRAIQPPDEATLALLKQLADLKKSEELQRQAAQMAQRAQPRNRVEFLQSQGLTEAEARFFDGNESMMQNQQHAGEAAAETLAAGFERDSPAFFQAVEQNFAKRIEAMNQQPAEQPTPAFFQPPEAPQRSPAAPDSASIYSAPVSRQTPSAGTGQRPARTVRLTAEEQEYARVAGITDVEYAKQKQKLAQAKANGDYGERR